VVSDPIHEDARVSALTPQSTHDALIGRFSSLQSFLRAVVYAPVWIETIARSVPCADGTLSQYGIHLSALGPLRLPRPVYYCTLLAASLCHTATGKTILLTPYRTLVRESEDAGALCQEIQQRLYEAVLASLRQSQHVAQVVEHASWVVPCPWSKVAGGFVYGEGRWRSEESQERSI
jgi:hypothetical protein